MFDFTTPKKPTCMMSTFHKNSQHTYTYLKRNKEAECSMPTKDLVSTFFDKVPTHGDYKEEINDVARLLTAVPSRTNSKM